MSKVLLLRKFNKSYCILHMHRGLESTIIQGSLSAIDIFLMGNHVSGKISLSLFIKHREMNRDEIIKIIGHKKTTAT